MIWSNDLIAHSLPPRREQPRRGEQPTWSNESKRYVVFGDWLRHILDPQAKVRHDMSDVDIRLAAIERKQKEIDARLKLLERQADIRGYRED